VGERYVVLLVVPLKTAVGKRVLVVLLTLSYGTA